MSRREPPRGPWHALSEQEVRRVLDVPNEGLAEQEAEARVLQYGPNEVEVDRPTPWWILLIHQFVDPLIYILLVAALVTLILRDYIDTGVILAVVVLNAAIGFVQESRAQKAMGALARMSAPQAVVFRGGSRREIPSRLVVPGDVVALSTGSRVPADIRLIESRGLMVNESALTGESVPVRKHTEPLGAEALVPGNQTNMAFVGTAVVRGRGRGIVVGTGIETELGQLAATVRGIEQIPAPLQESMRRFGRQVGVAILALSGIAGVIGLLRGMPPVEILLAAVALAVGAIPEGLPIVLTIALAIGVGRMAKRNAIIRSLPAVETLGSTTVIGSDKTGTLTRNEMSVRTIYAGGRWYQVTGVGYEPEGDIRHAGSRVGIREDRPLRQTLLVGTLANEVDPHSLAGDMSDSAVDPTEVALHVAAAKGELAPIEQRTLHPEIDLLPFEPERRFMSTLNAGQGGLTVYVKGAPEVVLSRCSSEATCEGDRPLDAERIRAAATQMAEDGLRVLAMAYGSVAQDNLDESSTVGDLVFAGLQGMEDPVRPEAIEAVRATRAAGVRVLMLTGDHIGTAQAVGRTLGLDPLNLGALEGRTISGLSDADLDRAIRRIAIYARVAPEHKLRIVQRLRADGQVVAVTGDGVNDAPALREAHLGIAMGRSGTDVAREASDMVLADDNFATIAAAVEEGRVIFSNVRKVTFFLLSAAVGEIIVILAAVSAGWPLPFVAAQLLWINLVTNGLQDVALAFEPGEPGLLGLRPRPRTEGVLTVHLVKRLAVVGAVLGVGTLGMFLLTLRTTGDLGLARTVAMTQMVIFQFFHAFNSRSLDRSLFRISPFSNRFLFVSIVIAAAAHLAVLYVPVLQTVFRSQPLSGLTWILLIVVGSSVIVGGEIDKWWRRRRRRLVG